MLSLLAGTRGTKPCSSQLPSAGGSNRNAWRRQQALQLQGSRFLAFDTLNQARMDVRTIFRREQTGLVIAAQTVIKVASPTLRGKRPSHGCTYGFTSFKK
ncbi:hypothetical protein AVEN_130040-1 [Araneus ventricosus]|uniref:Uncharacterized protein n=1 Tax=Araneus ventricosus TaxID=182803 RepID=A0A4Y2PS48_ARAVE|nr:hypothetical protein AVEN_130040-1 [Araneus ventricosus]